MVDRIKKIIDTKKMSSTQFADAIEVQRSSLSHVLSGRNKPSLDFMLKIKNSFPEINLDWLLLGDGEMNIQDSVKNSEQPETDIPELNFTENKTGVVEETLDKPTPKKSDKPLNPAHTELGSRNPVRVIMFYNDKTYESFEIRQ